MIRLPALLLMPILLAGQTLPSQTMEDRLRQIEVESGGVLGVAAMHLETGRFIGWRQKDHFPTMSVAKLPIVLRALSLMQAGMLPFRKMVFVEPKQFSSGFSPLRDKHPDGFVTTIGQLMESSLRDSDNTAHDVLIELSGGPEAAQQQLDRLFQGAIRINRSEKQMIADFDAMGAAAFDADGRDSSTPEAMTLLLSAIHGRKLVHPSSHERMIRWMTETPTGANRIKSQLPPGTVVWHKTGTGGDKDGINLCTNDAGVIVLPEGKGNLALTVFIKLSRKPLADRERAIAETAALFYQYFLTHPEPPHPTEK